MIFQLAVDFSRQKRENERTKETRQTENEKKNCFVFYYDYSCVIFGESHAWWIVYSIGSDPLSSDGWKMLQPVKGGPI